MNITILPKFRINTFTIIWLAICMFAGCTKYALAIFFIIVLHEFGHIFFIKAFGGTIKQVNFNIFGGKVDANLSNINLRYQKVLIDMGRHC